MEPTRDPLSIQARTTNVLQAATNMLHMLHMVRVARIPPVRAPVVSVWERIIMGQFRDGIHEPINALLSQAPMRRQVRRRLQLRRLNRL
jgi:hypothetical protein